MTESIMPHMPSPNASLLFTFQYLVYHQTHGIYHSKYIGGGAIFGGGFSDETKIEEGIKDTKNRRFVLYITIAAKSGGYSSHPATLALPPMTYGSHVSCLFLPLPYWRLLFRSNILFIIKHRSITFV